MRKNFQSKIITGSGGESKDIAAFVTFTYLLFLGDYMATVKRKKNNRFKV